MLHTLRRMLLQATSGLWRLLNGTTHGAQGGYTSLILIIKSPTAGRIRVELQPSKLGKKSA